jgi:hypothetical protein
MGLQISSTICGSFWNRKCRNPSLRLATKAKGLQGCGPRLSSGVAFSCPGSAKECEGKNPTLPSELPCWELESRWTLECSESDYKGQNPMARGVIYIIGKLLKRKCLKWACITHLDIWNISYDQKKGWESNWQFDSQPLKVENWTNFLACKWHVTYLWKVVNEG